MSRVLIVSNRLPVAVKRVADGELEANRTAGGLATGLKSVHEGGSGYWLGWPGIADDTVTESERAQLNTSFEALRVVPVPLYHDEIERYYEGFCNGILWPLFHYLTDRMPLEFLDFDLYRAINERFADAVVRVYQPGDVIWVHDYHLMLAPALIRQRVPDAQIGYFLHIPFPSSDVFRALPFREQLLEGLLGADLIGFHTAAYLRHFASTVLRTLGASTDVDQVQWGHRPVRLGVFPMGIDVARWTQAAARPAIQARAQSMHDESEGQIMLGIDRLDYTKGIPRRLLAFERLLERHPELHGKVRYVQCAVPSRSNVEAYQAFRAELDGVVGRIVGRFATPNWVPLHYMVRALPFEELVALYRAADVMVVTPLRDGMNLVAKEFAAVRDDGEGVLVLSEFAGAASELAEAVIVNPFDVEGTAESLYRALTMPPDERRTRMKVLRRRVLSAPVQEWAAGFVETLRDPEGRRKPRVTRTSVADMARVVQRIRQAPALLVLLDYDGTLVTFARTPELARPDASVLELLTRLAARPHTEVHVVSGRNRQTLSPWLGHLPIGLHCEHGFWSRRPGAQGGENVTTGSLEWKDPMRRILEDYTRRTPGSLVEEKAAGFAWHYRAAEPEFGAQQANELQLHVSEMFSNAPVEILPGSRVIEVRAQGINKGGVVTRLAQENPKALLVAIGDDRTDEDMFTALPRDRGISIHVGPSQSMAEYRVDNVADVHALLRQILA